jgi:hypothetical protein
MPELTLADKVHDLDPCEGRILAVVTDAGMVLVPLADAAR